MKKTIFTALVLVAVLSLLSIAAGPQAPAFDEYPSNTVWVCKYVNTPGVGEKLQTINKVNINAFPNFSGLGSEFADGQNRSVAIAWHTEKGDKPARSECPEPIPYETCSVTITIASNWSNDGAPDWGPWVDNGDGTSTRTGEQKQVSHYRTIDKYNKTLCESGTNVRYVEVSQTKDNGDPTYDVYMQCDRAAGDGIHYQAIIFFDLGQGAKSISFKDGQSFDSSGFRYAGFGKHSFTIHGAALFNDVSDSVKLTSGDCNAGTVVDASGPVDWLPGVFGALSLLSILGGAVLLRKRTA